MSFDKLLGGSEEEHVPNSIEMGERTRGRVRGENNSINGRGDRSSSDWSGGTSFGPVHDRGFSRLVTPSSRCQGPGSVRPAPSTALAGLAGSDLEASGLPSLVFPLGGEQAFPRGPRSSETLRSKGGAASLIEDEGGWTKKERPKIRGENARRNARPLRSNAH